jgi:hypothetical protein
MTPSDSGPQPLAYVMAPFLRSPLLDLIATLQELHAVGVGFVSLTEALDMTTPPVTGRNAKHTKGA